MTSVSRLRRHCRLSVHHRRCLSINRLTAVSRLHCLYWRYNHHQQSMSLNYCDEYIYLAESNKNRNGKWLPDFIERLKASAWHQRYLPLLPFTRARSESINADSLKLQLLTSRKKEWWPATADSLPQAVYLTTVKHTALVGIEPTTFRSWVQRATVVPPRPSSLRLSTGVCLTLGF